MPILNVKDSLELYYETHGSGKAIVFVHPPVMGHQVFMHQRALAKDYQLVFLDLPGHGKSTAGDQALDIPYLADCVFQLIEHLHLGPVTVCGFSHGTLIAQEFALQHPERTSALILCSGYPEVKTLNIKSLAVGGMVLSKLHLLPLIAKVLAKTHRYYREDEAVLYSYSLKADPQKIHEYIKQGLSYSAVPVLHRISQPVLVVYGTREKMNHRYFRDFEKELQHVEAAVVDNAPHELPPRFFREFNAIIRQFLKSYE